MMSSVCVRSLTCGLESLGRRNTITVFKIQTLHANDIIGLRTARIEAHHRGGVEGRMPGIATLCIVSIGRGPLGEPGAIPLPDGPPGPIPGPSGTGGAIIGGILLPGGGGLPMPIGPPLIRRIIGGLPLPLPGLAMPGGGLDPNMAIGDGPRPWPLPTYP